MGLIPKFHIEDLKKQLSKFAAEHEDRFIMGLRYIGEEFMNAARMINTYKDQTGNLRSSIGYAIYKDGKEVEIKIEGSAEGRELMADAAGQCGKGIWLIVVAGMNYALYVEAKGYDVLSGSRPTKSQILEMFKGVLNE